MSNDQHIRVGVHKTVFQPLHAIMLCARQQGSPFERLQTHSTLPRVFGKIAFYHSFGPLVGQLDFLPSQLHLLLQLLRRALSAGTLCATVSGRSWDLGWSGLVLLWRLGGISSLISSMCNRFHLRAQTRWLSVSLPAAWFTSSCFEWYVFDKDGDALAPKDT